MIRNAAKTQANVQPAADTPTVERFPVKSTEQQPTPVLVSPVEEKKN